MISATKQLLNNFKPRSRPSVIADKLKLTRLYEVLDAFKRNRARALPLIGGGALFTAYCAIWLFGTISYQIILDLFYFPLIGVIGAIIANAAGVGGGVVFIPAFNILSANDVIDLNMKKIVAISLMIQCFGMSVGSIRWFAQRQTKTAALSKPAPSRADKDVALWRIIMIVLAGCLPALWAVQIFADFEVATLLFLFKILSLGLGIFLLATTLLVGEKTGERSQLGATDKRALVIIGVLGGVSTALFSVGVGELLALYLFLRNFPLYICVAPAVIVSAITVISAAPWHLLNTDIEWEIVVLAAPGAMIGGYIARPIAEKLGAKRLKLLAATWISVSSLYLMAQYS